MLASAFQKNTNTNFQKTKIHYHELLAYSLILYAKGDRIFAQHLKYLVHTFSPFEATHFRSVYFNISVILPRDRYAAVLRADWLMQIISEESTSHASLILGSWAMSEEDVEPKQIVVGFVGIAIPGPTLGLIKRRVTMMVVMKNDISAISTLFTQHVVDVTQSVTLSELRRVKGDLYRLEPDFSEWFFGERDIVLYKATSTQFLDMQSECDDLSLTYASNHDESLLAASPLINDTFTSLKYNLERVNF